MVSPSWDCNQHSDAFACLFS